ncbi:hypothetical protein PR048_019504 [Dryococelus australis]|uniref:Uncharacterized protein n=1 Tax=Dryococelus australis TaxID=614101 RepID=A0ABQ9H3Y5_9NEOP|nr:hypothetical protein PR048_019504 [Dryococelus australis]
MKGRGKRDIPEKNRRPTASSGTIPTCKNPVRIVVALCTQRRREAGNGAEEAVMTGIRGGPRPRRPVQQCSRGPAGLHDCRSVLTAARPSFTSSPPTHVVPGRVTPGFSPCDNRAGRCRWSAGFLRVLQFHPAPSIRRCSIFTSINLIVLRQPLVYKIRTNRYRNPQIGDCQHKRLPTRAPRYPRGELGTKSATSAILYGKERLKHWAESNHAVLPFTSWESLKQALSPHMYNAIEKQKYQVLSFDLVHKKLL